MANKMTGFKIYSGTKQEFIDAGLAASHANSIVYIKGGSDAKNSCIFTQGVYFADFSEFISAINYVKGINVGGSSYNAAAGGGYLAFSAKDPATVAVSAGSNGIEIGLTEAFIKKVDDVAALASTINSDYLKSSDRTALEALIATADGKGQNALNAIAALNEDIGDVETLSTENKEVVKAINEVLAAVGSGGTAAVVTITEKGSSGDYAQIYEIKQGTTTVGTINIPKELVVESGEIVTNPSGQPAGTYIKLVIQNQTTPLYIDVAKLVDVYTVQENATQIQLDIDASRKVSATIVAGSVTATELAANAVITAKIADKNVTKAKLAEAVQSSLDKADSALQEEQYKGTVTQVTLRGVAINPDGEGVVDLGYEILRSVAMNGAEKKGDSTGSVNLGTVVTNVTKGGKNAAITDGVADISTFFTGLYSKPSGGIPKSDLASAVQTSLNKADNAAPQATTYTKAEVDAMWEWEEL